MGADLRHYPQKLIGTAESAARKKGYGHQVDVGNRYAGKVGDLWKWYQDINYEPYPAKEKGIHGALDRGLSNVHDWYGKIKIGSWLLWANRVAKDAPGFLSRHFSLIDIAWNALATIKDIRNKDWRRAKFHAGMTAFYALMRKLARKGWTAQAWQGARRFVTEKAAPWAAECCARASRGSGADGAQHAVS